jgi:hypothetical protein
VAHVALAKAGISDGEAIAASPEILVAAGLTA